MGVGTPAHHAGLCVGDVVLSVNGVLCRSAQQAFGLLEDGPRLELCLEAAPYNQEFVSALVHRPEGMPAGELVAAELAKLAPVKRRAEVFCARHRELLEAAVAANTTFVASIRSASEGALRAKQSFLRGLGQAVAMHEALSAEVAQGASFFRAVGERIASLRARASGLAAERHDIVCVLRAGGDGAGRPIPRKPAAPAAKAAPAASCRAAPALGGRAAGTTATGEVAELVRDRLYASLSTRLPI